MTIINTRIWNIAFALFISLLSSISASSLSAEPLNVELTVKEVSGVGSNGFPVQSVIPLPYGVYQDASSFTIVDDAGNAVPAQFEVHNRWWAKDKSLRHIVVHFQPQVGAFTEAGTGQTKYWLKDTDDNILPATTVTISNSSQKLTVNTGATSFTINKAPFSIQTPKGNLNAELQFWDRVKNATVLQKSLERDDISIEVEESGPMRSVIKISAPTIYNAVDDHLHGWAIRLYAYAGKPYIKIDYQLQNSANNAVFSAPLYFKSMNLVLETGDTTSAQQARSVVVTKKEQLDLRGAISTGSTQAIIRNFTQMYPNGLDVTSNGKLTIELWPEWGEKFYWLHDAEGETIRHEADKYWLDDMQHVYKEVLLNFGSMDATQLSELADTFQYPPVVSLPVSWYADTKVTLGMGGVVPYRERISNEDLRKPQYSGKFNRGYDIDDDMTYWFGWNIFSADVYRRNRTNITGDIPAMKVNFMLTENPADYYQDLDFAIGELNMRPQWLAGYNHDADHARLKLSDNPYGGASWRRFDGHNKPYLAADYLPDTKKHAHPRDSAHGWFYHIEEAYNQSANLWIKDWYGFVGEFRKTFLNQLDPYPDGSSRGQGHALNHALQAYRVTGDTSILSIARDAYVHTTLSSQLHPITKVRTSHTKIVDGIRQEREGLFQMGYLSQSLIDLYLELENGDQTTLEVLTGFMDWNLNIANFAYYLDNSGGNLPDTNEYGNPVSRNGVGVSNGNSIILVDPQLWVAQKLGRTDLITHLETFLEKGLNGGTGAQGYVPLTRKWEGRFIGRLYTDYVLNNTGIDNSTTVTLSYSAEEGGTITGNTSQTIDKNGSGTTVTAVANTGYTFTAWSDGKTSATRTDSNVVADKALTAQFSKDSDNSTTFTLSYSATQGGTITGNTHQTINKDDSGSAVTAVANTGYSFKAWSDGSTSATRIDINVVMDKVLIAQFTKGVVVIPDTSTTFTLSYFAEGGGTITGNTHQKVNKNSSGSSVTAVAHTGYTFKAWSDGKTNATRIDNNVVMDEVLIAQFTQVGVTSDNNSNKSDSSEGGSANPVLILILGILFAVRRRYSALRNLLYITSRFLFATH